MNRFLISVFYSIFVSTYLHAQTTFSCDGVDYDIIHDDCVEIKGFATDSVSAHMFLKRHPEVLNISATLVHNGKTFKVKGIAENAFMDCNHIRSVNLDEGIEYIGRHAFLRCVSLQNIHIPASVKRMDESFLLCPDVKTIDVASGNNEYDSREGCNAIIESRTNRLIVACQSTRVPNSVIRIGADSFHGQFSLERIALPEGIEVIEDFAFMDCVALHTVDLPTTLKKIGLEAFSNTALTQVRIPKNVETVAEGIFEGCNALEIIEVDPMNSYYDSRNKCNAIIQTSTGALVMGCKNTVIPNDVTSIEMYAFSRMSSLTDLFIPQNVNSISVSALRECTGLTKIEVSSENPFYDSRDECNAIIRKANGGELVVGCITTIIPSNIEHIGAYAFEGRGTPNSLYIPANIKTIGNDAFARCNLLQSVYLPETLQEIGPSAFSNCYNLRAAYLPISMKKIPDYLFAGCYNLKNLRWTNGQKQIGMHAFEGCNLLY